jgi:hypothetical protein
MLGLEHDGASFRKPNHLRLRSKTHAILPEFIIINVLDGTSGSMLERRWTNIVKRTDDRMERLTNRSRVQALSPDLPDRLRPTGSGACGAGAVGK